MEEYTEVMALRNSPYLPLYVQDFMTDERLAECSASATGVYIRLMCLLHKSEQYGTILLKQKYKQTDNQIYNFALNLSRHFPYTIDEINSGLMELEENGVIAVSGDSISQKRMIKDGRLSEIRSESGRKGGNISSGKDDFCLSKTSSKTSSKNEANSDIDIDIDNDIINDTIDNYKKEEDFFVLKIYKMYPTKCPVRDASLSKSDKDKVRIRTLMKKYSKEQIESVVRYEVESKHGKIRMYNFSTFLNNFPDPTCLFEEDEELKKNTNDKYYK